MLEKIRIKQTKSERKHDKSRQGDSFVNKL